ncbi:flagellar assembly protein FliW [Nocardioides mangrovi]|uniref:Flagellar assembly factor FliW n=1 Tax=Nocardioides mangrovi TaxID=2874580 RepID=A0ABS7U9Y4_9ACTN|nr:flagellar assembly protein FliW [Nocardioides mangrovi]MBZ5737798.1 flagellar assembly protein FliW [Nocardioides mangrovi]
MAPTPTETTVEGGAVPESLEIPVIEMVRPLPGFPDHTRFALVQLEPGSDLFSLTSLDEEGLRFLVVPPMHFFPDYAPEVGDDVVEDLRIESAADVLVLVVLNPGAGLGDTTANLAAPLLVNPGARVAGQIVLDEPGLPVAAPLLG